MRSAFLIFFFMLIIISIFIARVFFFSSSKPLATRRPIVRVEEVKLIKIHQSISSLGALKAKQEIEISSSVPGIVRSIYFHSGQFVQKGDLLLELANEDLQAKWIEDHQKYLFLRRQYQRYQHLFKGGAIARADMDSLMSSMIQSRALSHFDWALLEKTRIRAPFSGKLGINRSAIGQYLLAGSNIVSLYDPSQIQIDFSLPASVSDLIRIGDSIEIVKDKHSEVNFKGLVLSKEIGLSRETLHQEIRARVMGNFQSLNLLPGMLMRIRIFFAKWESIIVVPESAIQYSPEGEFVYVFDQGVIRHRMVETQIRRDGFVQVKKGLFPREEIVVSGFSGLWDGAVARVR